MHAPVRPLTPEHYDAVIFDMDGVITDTASIHARAWMRLFDDFLRARSQRTGDPFVPFDLDVDYRAHVDGKARLDGVRSFLAARGIDVSDAGTVASLGARKDGYFLDALAREGARPYVRTIQYVRELRRRGLPVAIISASRNCARVLEAAGVDDLFDARVDGAVSEQRSLPGKPDPAIFIEAARRLGASPDRTVIFEDALAGVEAGRRGGFGLVVGVDRTGHPGDLLRAGADLVVRDPADLEVQQVPRPIVALPHALEHTDELLGWFGRRQPLFFVDFDGTLSPIVPHPDQARIADDARKAVRSLARRYPVAIMSGRDLPDLEERVGLTGVIYAGSHGFDIAGPDGLRYEFEDAAPYLADLDAIEAALRARTTGIAGAVVDRKRYAVALHDRMVGVDELPVMEAIATDEAKRRPRLALSRGKRVHEFRPALPWDKGRALLWLVDALGLRREAVTAMYVGDDTTDEDAFRALREAGIGVGVVVGDSDRESWAEYRVSRPEEAWRLLAGLPGWLAERQPGPELE